MNRGKQMSDVKRYDVVGDALIWEETDGDYVLHTDYKAALEKIAELEAERKDWDDRRHQAVMSLADQMVKTVETVKERNLVQSKYDELFVDAQELRTDYSWLIKHSWESGAISKAKAAELLGVPLIDFDEAIEGVDE